LHILFLAGLLVALTSSLSAKEGEVCDGSACFDKVSTAGEEKVSLVGVGRLRYWGFSVYSAAFYLNGESRIPEDFLGEKPKRLVLHYHRRVTRDQIIEASDRALDEMPGLDKDAVMPGFKKINGLYKDVRDGDRYELVYEPGSGTTLILNGKELGVIEGEDFARALFGIWLSEYSLSDSLRDRLLGRD